MQRNTGLKIMSQAETEDGMLEVEENATALTEARQSRVNYIARSCARIAFAKHIAIYNMLSDPEAFLKIED